MSVRFDYQWAIAGAIRVGLKGAIPSLQRVEDADIVAFENREGTPPEEMSYPFATFRFEDEGQVDGLPMNPPPVDENVEVSSVSNSFSTDILQRARYPWDTELTITLYHRMQYPRGHNRENEIDRQAGLDCARFAREAQNWFATAADGRVNPTDGSLEGLFWTLIDPNTGDWVDQDNPPNTAVRVDLTVTELSRIANRATILDQARGEHRREFTVRVGGAQAYEMRVPTIETVTVSPSYDVGPATPVAPTPPRRPITTDPEIQFV